MSESIDGLKQRLVGAFVIITLAIIFLPMIFDKPHVIGNTKIVPVPPRPDFQTVVVKPAQKPEFELVSMDKNDKVQRTPPEQKIAKAVPASKPPVEAPAKAKAEGTKAESGTPVTPPQKSVTPREKSLSVFKNVWMVQLGTFSDISG